MTITVMIINLNLRQRQRSEVLCLQTCRQLLYLQACIEQYTHNFSDFQRPALQYSCGLVAEWLVTYVHQNSAGLKDQ